MPPYGELFLVPHPSGDGAIERAATTESKGTDSAGALVGLNGDGLISDSMLPYANAVDIADTEYESATLLTQVLTQEGRVWRWFGITALLEWLRDQVMDIVAPVGTLRWDISNTDVPYWVQVNGRKVGNTDSAADLAGEQYKRLFLKLWNTNASLKVFNAAGQEMVRNATAQLDWDANRNIQMPDMRGRKLTMAGQGAGLQNRPLGQLAGKEESLIEVQNLPKHKHTTTQAITGAPETLNLMTDVTGTVVVNSTALSTATTVIVGSVVPGPAEAQKPTVTVTTRNARVGSHGHTITPSGAWESAPHVHVSTGKVEVDGTEYPFTNTVESAVVSWLSTPTFAAATYTDTTGHTHTMDVVVSGNNTGGEHGHEMSAAATTKVTTTVANVPVLTLKPTKITKTITSVGDQSVETSEAGGGVAFNTMDPDMTAGLFIRY